MFKRPPSDPRSPVQEGGSSGALPTLLFAGLLALLFWGWQQDWTAGTVRDQPAPKSAQGLPRQAAPGPSLSVRPPAQRARASLAAYFTDDDYPAAAIRNEEQGTTAFVLAVSPEGRIRECRIAQGSGSSTLDAATCRILQARARYQPARDSNGKTVPDEVRGRIKWVLPVG